MAVVTDTEAPRLLTRAVVLGDALATFKPDEDKLWLETIAARLRDEWAGEYVGLDSVALRQLLDTGDRAERVASVPVWGLDDGRGGMARGIHRADLERAYMALRERGASPVERLSPAERLWRLLDALSATCDRVMPILGAGCYLALIVAVAVLVARGW